VPNRSLSWEEALDHDLMSEVDQRSIHLLSEINEFIQAGRNDKEIESLSVNMHREIDAIQEIIASNTVSTSITSKSVRKVVESIVSGLEESQDAHRTSNSVLIGWTITHALGRIESDNDYPARSRSWLDEFLFGKILANTLINFGLDEPSAWRSLGMVKILTTHQNWSDQLRKNAQLDYQIVSEWLKDGEIQRYLQVNRYQGILWFNHEAYIMLLRWMVAIAIIKTIADPSSDRTSKTRKLSNLGAFFVRLETAESRSEYQVEKLLDHMKG
jgi:hypothetical protein